MAKKSAKPKRPTQIDISYIKSNFFRVMVAEGFIAGVTPHGMIHIEAYSQRAAIPEKIVHSIKPDGTLGKEITERRKTKGGIVREVECQFVMRPELVESFITILKQQLANVETFKVAGKGVKRVLRK